MKRTLLSLSVVALFAATGCYELVDGGAETSQTRTLDAWDAVRVADGLHVKVVKGAPQAEITAPAKVLDVLDTTVSKGVLKVALKPGVAVTSTSTIAITVSGDAVTSVEADEASQVNAADLSGTPVRVIATGGSQVTVTGATDDLRLAASGASQIDASGLPAKDVSVDASGASQVKLQATGAVVGTASGGSQLTITGGGDTSRVSLSGASTMN